MNFKLTSSQMNFYNKKFTLDSQIWNQGVMQIFPDVYSYEQINNAYNKLVEAHDSLRVKLVETEDGVVADVREHEHINYRFWQVETEAELMSKAQDFLNEPIDRYGLLVNCAVFQTPTKSGFMISAHHIVVDGFSAFVMAEHVNSFLKDESFAPDIQKYPDYVEAEEKFKQSRRYEKSKQYWLKQFSSNPKCNIFPAPDNIIDFSSAELNKPIPAELFDKIKAFCNENDITPASFFNTAIAVYLKRKYDVDSFTIGVPVFNRTTPDELNTIGLYMHLVPLVISLENDTFISNAQRINDSQINLFRHQSFTQHDIKLLLSENNLAVNQLFDIVSDYQEFTPNKEYEIRIPYANSLSVPIEMHLQTFDGFNYNLKLRYRTAYFEENEAQHILSSIVALAENALEGAEKNICEIEMLSPGEKQKVLYDFNSTEHNYDVPEKSTLYSLFEKNAIDNADKVCLKIDNKEFTFKDFRKTVEVLDCKIREITKDKKSIVAVICERSQEMYTAVYGIIRGGNAYLPIDPDYPQDRIEYILENSGAALVVAQDKFSHLASNVPCINLTDIINNPIYVTDIPPCTATEDDTAYVIYTSGSTGKPKGARVSHKSAVNRILWMHDKYPLINNDVILQKTPYTFDVSVWELFWWGILGGCLAPSKPGEHFLPGKILEEVFRNRVTHLHFVPSVFELFLNYTESHKGECFKFDSVKYVFLSGEALSANLIKRFYELFDYNKVTLHNLYGPTECAVDVTYYDCSPADTDPIPIGKPIYNTQMYIVDEYMKLLPIGVTGELCICGVNVGQGYLNNPDLTAQKFIDNPFGEGKLYKTGDLAYWREDGNIGFVGRIDSQIKLNGQRIEIGEIETVINSIDFVETVAVIVRKINGIDTLVAFYSGTDNTENEIRDICSNKLPKYMVPSAIIHLDALPLNQSGKLDRKALAQMQIAATYTTESDVPVNEKEKFICSAFEKVLGLNKTGRNTDFFENGGTSLSMIALLSEDGFEEITASEFMRNPTPAKLAQIFRNKQPEQFEYLEPLYLSDAAVKAIILLPFAGGGSEAFSQLVSSIKKKDDKAAVYFIPYLHSFEECENAAKEIANHLGDKEIIVYSHCVGSAIALQILKNLEKDNIHIKHYFAGASIPLAKPTEKNIWNLTPDKILKYILKKAGARFESLTEEKLRELLGHFRTDTDFANISYYHSRDKLSVPLTLIISKADVFTKNYKSAERIWQKYFSAIESIHFIDTKDHYFQAQKPDEVADIILSE